MADSAHMSYWQNQYKLPSGYTLIGYSRAREATGFYCLELDMAFDAGVPTDMVPEFICLTHLHSDHVSCLHKMLIGNTKNPLIFIPNDNKFEELLVTMLKSIYLASKYISSRSQKGSDPKTKFPYQLLRLNVGQAFEFKKLNNSSYFVEGLPSDHGVGSISFGIYESRKKCKAGYENLSSSEYLQLKKDGIIFTEQYKHPIICYMSDTTINALLCPSNIFSYPVIVIECTFIDPDDLCQVKKKKHIHWDQLYPIIQKQEKNIFILTHFSKKYTWSHVKDFFDKNTVSTQIVVW